MPRLTLRSTAASLVAAAILSGCAAAPAPSAGTATAPAASSDDGTGAAVVLDAPAAVALLADRDDVIVLDVRTPAEHAEGHLDGTLLVDIQDAAFASRVDELDRDRAYLVYCRSGNRSANAVATMAQMGFTELYDAGGFDDLAAAGAPTAP